jgi:SAM-dependent methyltransferase
MAVLHRPVYAARLRELVRRILPYVREGDHILDVGCGNGALGKALLDAPGRPVGISVTGLERFRRGGEPIEVIPYDGVTIPAPAGTYDVVILADVLHHEENPDRLIDECIRVCKRLVVVKDHQVLGPLARQRVSFIDWAANAPYGVRCLYRYNTPAQWRATPGRHGAKIAEELSSMNLYPPLLNLLFGRRLQYMAFWKVNSAGPGDLAEASGHA